MLDVFLAQVCLTIKDFAYEYQNLLAPHCFKSIEALSLLKKKFQQSSNT